MMPIRGTRGACKVSALTHICLNSPWFCAK